ncbi:MAG: hypothetical protein WDN28_33960 [Chthoniobacter sp.]
MAPTFTDLAPLRGLPLRRLSLNGTPVEDLSPLAGMALQSLSLNGTKVKDFSPLRAMPLQEIYVSNLGLADLAVLRGRPLHRLDIGNNPLADISALAGMPLEWLVASGTAIGDLAPLQGMPLKYLSISRTRCARFRTAPRNARGRTQHRERPGAGFLARCSISPSWKSCASSAPPQQLDVLRKHPTLKYLALGAVGPLRPVADFWKDYERRTGQTTVGRQAPERPPLSF